MKNDRKTRVTQAVLKSERSHYARCIVMYLCHISNDEGVASVSRATIAERLRMSASSVDRALVELQSERWLAVQRRRGQTTKYRLFVDVICDPRNYLRLTGKKPDNKAANG